MLGETLNNPSGILLYAKQQDITSFSSLWAVKHALKTQKVGHTGTLDSFADGLLVVLMGKLTRLVPHITAFDKTYIGVIAFGSETDTLDPTGKVVKQTQLPLRADFDAAMTQFRGDIMQSPPLFSAVHVGGKRASDLALRGELQELPERKVHIYELSAKDVESEISSGEERVKYAMIYVRCSKGTYIRSLARDIAYKCGSSAHLIALRRLAVGPFLLENAVGAEKLPPFSIESAKNKAINGEISDKSAENAEDTQIQMSLKSVTAEVAQQCGFFPAQLTSAGEAKYAHGRKLCASDFSLPMQGVPEKCSLGVFYRNSQFAGVVEKRGNALKYGFSIPKSDFLVFSWADVMTGRFPESFKKQGTALTIGSFDGPHIGHEALFYDVLAAEKLLHGVVTFTKSLRALKTKDYAGDIVSLPQKLEICRKKGFNFAIVIDFSADFGRISGYDFFNYLVDFCGLRFLAEGIDFHCGYRGACGMTEIVEIGKKLGFDTSFSESIMYKNQRVSSSFIRQCILKRDFLSAKMMLQRDFSYDASQLDWKKEKTADKRFVFKAKRKNGLVLPPNDSYNVRVILSGEDCTKSPYIYRMAIDLTDSELVLYSDKNLSARYIQTILFDKE